MKFLILSIFSIFHIVCLQKDFGLDRLTLSLINKNPNLFRNQKTSRVFYAEKEAYEKKLQIEIILRNFLRTFNSNYKPFINELLEKSLLRIMSKPNLDMNGEDPQNIIHQLNKTWFAHCDQFGNQCIKECEGVGLGYKGFWCDSVRGENSMKKIFKRNLISEKYGNESNLKYFSQIGKNNLTKEILLDEIINELIEANMKNSFAFIAGLAESSMDLGQSSSKELKINSGELCQQGFRLKNTDFCIDVNECEDYFINSTGSKENPCDENAVCVNTFGSFKCKCRKGFVGNGLKGNCFNGTFCSGKFCRHNGECLYDNNYQGYKCKCMLSCLNGGKCVISQYKYECKCLVNTTGILCNETVGSFLTIQKTIQNLKNPKSAESLLLGSLTDLIEPAKPNLDNPQFNKFYSLFNSSDNFTILNLVNNYMESQYSKENNKISLNLNEFFEYFKPRLNKFKPRHFDNYFH